MSEFARPIDISEGGRVKYGLDEGLMVEFYTKPIKMEAASLEHGSPVFEDRIFCRIISPGNPKTQWDYQAKGVVYEYTDEGEMSGYRLGELVYNERGETVGFRSGEELDPLQCDPIRFPKAWARFEKKGEKVKDGWPIEEWGAITRSQAESLRAQSILTVEALASMSDAAVSNVMGGRKYRDLAKAAMSDADNLELASKEQERANKAEENARALQSQIDGLKAEVAALVRKKSA